MSILIKGMKMPKNCAYCPLSEYRNTSLGQILDCKRIGTVGTALRDTHDVLNRRHPNCPLIELPPHGRLGDLDELKTAFPICDNSMDIKIASVRATINHAPTIIEAEGEKE